MLVFSSFTQLLDKIAFLISRLGVKLTAVDYWLGMLCVRKTGSPYASSLDVN